MTIRTTQQPWGMQSVRFESSLERLTGRSLVYSRTMGVTAWLSVTI